MGLGPADEVVHGAHLRRADDLSRHGRAAGPAHPLLRAHGAAGHRLRLRLRPHAHPFRHAPGKLPLQRPGDVPAQARGIPLVARRRELLDALVQAARGPRVPPRGAVQQPRPGRDPRAELPAGAAGVDRRPALHAHLGHGGRRRDVGDHDVVVRARAPALLLDGLQGHGARGRRPARASAPQRRQVVLRLLPRLRARPLRAGLPALLLCLGALRRERVGQGGALRLAQPLHAGHHAHRPREVLRHQRLEALPRDLRRAPPLLGRAARH